jgi:predicted metalloprotease with PDZ domain
MEWRLLGCRCRPDRVPRAARAPGPGAWEGASVGRQLMRGYRQLLIAIAVASCGCAGLSRPDGGRLPFLSYAVTLKSLDLRVVHVSGTVYAAGVSDISLGSIPSPDAVACDPIGLAAADSRGGALRVRREAKRWVVENRRRDFIVDYDVVLPSAERSSSNVRAMITAVGDDRSRLLARDLLLVPEIPVERGIILDVAMGPGRLLEASSPSVGRRVIVPDLDELPFTMVVSGAYRVFSRTVGGAELVLAIGDSWSFGDAEFFDVVCRVVTAEVALFGAPPRDRYLFVLDGNPVQGGARFDYYGLHYGGNMILLLDRRLDRSQLIDTPMSIIAHEFFHNWNGEALRPVSDSFLWFTEGVTTYYSYRVLLDARIITEGQYAARAEAIGKRYRENPLARSEAIGASGNSDMRDRDRVSLLYDGGFLAARALDERLRAETSGRISLIDVLRKMYDDAGGHGAVDEQTFVAAVHDLCGLEIAPFLNTLVHTPASPVLAAPAL